MSSPAESPTQSKSSRLSKWALRLLILLQAMSRVSAYRGSIAILAQQLGTSVRTVHRALKELRDQKRIQEHSRKRYRGHGSWFTEKVTYLVATRPDEKGALQVAHLARNLGMRTTKNVGLFCGRLQCTPSQFERWLKIAADRGWVEVETTDGLQIIKKKAKRLRPVDLPETFSRRELIDTHFEHGATWVAPSRDPVRDALIRALTDCFHFKYGDGVAILTNEQLRERVPRCARSTLQAKLKRLCADGQYFRYRFGRRRLLSPTPLTPEQVRCYMEWRMQRPQRKPTGFHGRGRPRTAPPRFTVREVTQQMLALAAARRIDTLDLSRIKVTAAEVKKLATSYAGCKADERPRILFVIAGNLLDRTLPQQAPAEPLREPEVPLPQLRVKLRDPYTGKFVEIGAEVDSPREVDEQGREHGAQHNEEVTSDQPRWFPKLSFELIDPFTGKRTLVG